MLILSDPTCSRRRRVVMLKMTHWAFPSGVSFFSSPLLLSVVFLFHVRRPGWRLTTGFDFTNISLYGNLYGFVGCWCVWCSGTDHRPPQPTCFALFFFRRCFFGFYRRHGRRRFRGSNGRSFPSYGFVEWVRRHVRYLSSSAGRPVLFSAVFRYG